MCSCVGGSICSWERIEPWATEDKPNIGSQWHVFFILEHILVGRRYILTGGLPSRHWPWLQCQVDPAPSHYGPAKGHQLNMCVSKIYPYHSPAYLQWMNKSRPMIYTVEHLNPKNSIQENCLLFVHSGHLRNGNRAYREKEGFNPQQIFFIGPRYTWGLVYGSWCL